MRLSYLFAPVFALAVVIAVNPAGGADKPAVAEPQSIKLPGRIAAGVVGAGDGFCHAVTSDGQLLRVYLDKGEVTTVAVKEKLLPCLDVSLGRACVASDGKVHVIDLTAGKITNSLEVKGRVLGVGLFGRGQAFARTATAVTVFDVAEEKVVRTIDLGEKEEKAWPAVATHYHTGSRLYVPSAFDGSLLVVDLAEGKVLDRIATDDWRLGSVVVSGEKAFVVGLRLGYGVWTESVGVIDLKTKKLTALKVPASTLRACTLTSGPDGTIVLVEPEKAFRYDVEGKLLGPVEMDNPAGRVLGFWNGRAVFAAAETIRFAPVATVPGQDAWVGQYTRPSNSKPGERQDVELYRDGNGYRLKGAYSSWKFVESEKGVLKDEERVLGTIQIVKSASDREATVLRAEFCYEAFELMRK